MAVDTVGSGPRNDEPVDDAAQHRSGSQAEKETLSGLDRLDLGGDGGRSRGRRIWSAVWPKLLAIAIAIFAWQVVVLSGWKESWVLPPPLDVYHELVGHQAKTSEFWSGIGTTLRRAVVGFAFATVIGLVVGIAVARVKVLRAAIGSMITALQTMPSIAWFPLAILLFKLTEGAIQFVIILGAAPSIANGVISGVDYVPPILLRAGRNVGAKGLALYRHVIAPASLPAIVSGLKQGWAFAWRSLMAGELLVIIPGVPALGAQLNFARETNDAAWVIAMMAVIFVIGIAVDVLFGAADRAVRRMWGVDRD
jgi:NitT/TauT family transport system permease protein